MTAVTMPAGIIGGGDDSFYTAFIFWPGHLALLFGVMAALVLATVGQRLIWPGDGCSRAGYAWER